MDRAVDLRVADIDALRAIQPEVASLSVGREHLHLLFSDERDWGVGSRLCSQKQARG